MLHQMLWHRLPSWLLRRKNVLYCSMVEYFLFVPLSFFFCSFFYLYPAIVLHTQLKYFKDTEILLGSRLGEAETKALLSRALIQHWKQRSFNPFTTNPGILPFYSQEEYVDMVINNFTAVIKVITIRIPPSILNKYALAGLFITTVFRFLSCLYIVVVFFLGNI